MAPLSLIEVIVPWCTDPMVKKATKKINEQVEKTTLGDVFGNLKEELEKKEEKGQE